MRSRDILACVLVSGALCCACLPTSGQSGAQSGHTSAPPTGKRQGFFDYALGKINPQEKDYGASIGAHRTGMVEHSVDDLYFWSNVVSLILLCGVSAIVLFQWRSADKREVIAASLIAQLWNGRVSDRVEIECRTEEYNRLAETHNTEVERALTLKPPSTERDKDADLTRNIRKLGGKGAAANGATQLRFDMERAVATGGGSAVELEQSNLLLQRRVEALQNSEQNLKQRLNQTTVLLDQERRRNATLKGA